MGVSNPFATLAKGKKPYGGGGGGFPSGGEGGCGANGEGTCGGSHPTVPDLPETPNPTPPTPSAPAGAVPEDGLHLPPTLNIAPSTQSLDIGGLATAMAKMVPQGQGASLMFGQPNQQSLPNQAARGKENYLDGMSRTWR